MKGEDVTHLPNMVYRRNRDVVRNPRVDVDLRYLPKPHRRIFDNRRYEQLCRFGIAAGVRVYLHTPLAEAIVDGSIRGGLHPDAREAPHQPVFYLSPLLGDDVFALIHQLVDGDPRFLVLSAPTETGSYNYADAKVLCQLIEKGARGAYWDIIRRSQRY
jgi:hypothetical protein